jgi:DNA-3-methyladenine glycosylase I
MGDAGIVRHRGKIEATINNARRAKELVRDEGSLAAYFWRSGSLANPATDTSRALAKDLKKRGWKFVGPTTVHAFMQAMGLVNDHAEECVIHRRVVRARKKFRRPGR